MLGVGVIALPVKNWSATESIDTVVVVLSIGNALIVNTISLDVVSTFSSDTTVNLTFGFSHEAVIRNLYFRLGFLGYFSNEPEMSFVTTPFLSPTLGIAYRDIEIGNVLAELSADYYLGHLFYDGMKFAMDFSLNFSLILADYDKADIGVNFGVRDAIFAMEEGLQNQLKLIISIGVINND